MSKENIYIDGESFNVINNTDRECKKCKTLNESLDVGFGPHYFCAKCDANWTNNEKELHRMKSIKNKKCGDYAYIDKLWKEIDNDPNK